MNELAPEPEIGETASPWGDQTTPPSTSPSSKAAWGDPTPAASSPETAHSWVSSDLERRRMDRRLAKLRETLERQNKELDALIGETESDAAVAKLRIGNKASRLLLQAEERARELGHRAVGTGDILWAMFDENQEDSTAVRFLRKRGVTRDSVYASHRYSDNAGTILQLAAQRSSELNKAVVGTEDLLWAMFQTDDHTHSRSQAVSRLEARGVNMDLIWNQAELSKNAQDAMRAAVEKAKATGDRTIGSEDLVEALFMNSEITRDSSARRWMTAQHLPPTAGLSSEPGAEDESIGRMFVVGGLAGVIETFIVQPLVYWKTMTQVSPESLYSLRALKPSMMYRGVFVNAASIGPVSAFQYGSNGVLTTLHRSFTGRSTTTGTEAIAIAATTGALSSLVVTPAELVMIQQQVSGRSVLGTLASTWRAAGGVTAGVQGLYRGLAATCAREAGWTLGFLGLAPQLKQVLQDDSKFFHHNDMASSLAASVLAGQAAALLTQPADTVKSLMQAPAPEHPGGGGGSSQPPTPRYASTWDACKHLYSLPRQQGGGLGAFWRGIVPRSVRCIAAVFILGESQNRLSDLFDGSGILMNRRDSTRSAELASSLVDAASPSPTAAPPAPPPGATMTAVPTLTPAIQERLEALYADDRPAAGGN